MGALDLFLLLLMIAVVVSASRRGFARAGIGTLFFWAGILAACWLYPFAAFFLREKMPPKMANVTGFLLILGILAAAGGVVGLLASRWVKAENLNLLDHSLGAVFGVLDGAVLATVIVVVLALLAHPMPERLIAGSCLAPHLTSAALAAEVLLPEDVRERLEESYEDARRVLPLKLKDRIEEPAPPEI